MKEKKIQCLVVVLSLLQGTLALSKDMPNGIYRESSEVEMVYQQVPLTTGNPNTYFGAYVGNWWRSYGYPEMTIQRDADYDKTPHVLFFVHGLLGAHETFGHMENLLKRDIGPKKNLRVKNLTYPTITNGQSLDDFISSKSLHPYDFAKVINTKIISYLIESGLDDLKRCQESQSDPKKASQVHGFRKCLTRGKSDVFTKDHINSCAQEDSLNNLPACATNIVNLDTPYSVVVHSQGGLTMASYLNSCYQKTEDNKPSTRCPYAAGLKVYKKVSGLFTESNIAEKKEPKAIEIADQYDARKIFHNISLKENAGTPKNFKAMVSLGSPFWGSPTANDGQSKFLQMDSEKAFKTIEISTTILSNFGIDIPFPIRQVFRLAVGSAGLSWQRNLLLKRHKMIDNRTGKPVESVFDWGPDVQFTRQVPDDLKVYNVAGVISQLNDGSHEQPLNSTEQRVAGLAKPAYYENDVIVGAPEARLDFIYSLENPVPGKLPLEGISNLTTEYIPLHTAHVPLGPNAIGMANVTYENHETHVVYDLIRSVLRKEFSIREDKQSVKDKIRNELVEELRNFTSEIKVYTPIGYHRRFRLSPERISIVPENEEVFSELQLESKFYVQASGYNQADEKLSDHYPQTYYHVGKVSPEFAFKPKNQTLEQYRWKNTPGKLGHTLSYGIDVLGFKAKSFDQYVLPSMNSYKETFLTPYLPFPVNKPERSMRSRTLVASVPVTENETRNFYILPSGELEYENEFFSSPLVCHVGLLGQPSPPRFRFKSIHRSDYRSHPKHLEAFQNDDSIVVKNFESGLLSNTPLLSDWFWYAPHKNIPILEAKQSTSPLYDPLAFKDVQMTAGTPFEVLGRYTEGFVDRLHGHGRDCVKEEVGRYEECEIKSLDLYLVTSPEIRREDGVTIEELGMKVTTKSMFSKGVEYTFDTRRGLRWIPVKDMDMIQPHQNIDAISAYDTTRIGGSECIWDNQELNYMPPEYYFEQFHYPHQLIEN